MFTVSCTSDKIWNTTDLVGYLAANQGADIELNINPEAICLTNIGLYDLLDKFSFGTVNIHTWNPLEQHNKYNIQLKSSNFWFDRIADIDPELHKWDLRYRFLCFYHRPTAARLALAGHLWNNQRDTSLIHFSASDTVDFELDKLLQWSTTATVNAATMLPNLPMLQGDTSGYTKFDGYYYTDKLTEMYRSILVDVVVESHVAGNTFFPTEKTIRPMLLKKPFMVFGSRDYLAYLRQMGFRTFHDFWDEDYDGYEAADRLVKTSAVLDQLATVPLDKLQTMYWDMQYTLDHNYNLLMSKQYNRRIKQLA